MAARQLSSQGAAKFHFLASDGWGKQAQVVAGVEDFAVGAITVELESKRIQGKWEGRRKVAVRLALDFGCLLF